MKSLSDFIINEGTDIVPENSDGAADWASDFYKATIQLLCDKCKECLEFADKQCAKDPEASHASWSWSIIGMVRPYLEMLINAKREWNINEEVMKYLYDAIDDCENDLSFHQGWKDYNEFKKALKDQRELIDKINKEKEKLDKEYPDRWDKK